MVPCSVHYFWETRYFHSAHLYTVFFTFVVVVVVWFVCCLLFIPTQAPAAIQNDLAPDFFLHLPRIGGRVDVFFFLLSFSISSVLSIFILTLFAWAIILLERRLVDVGFHAIGIEADQLYICLSYLRVEMTLCCRVQQCAEG